MKKPGYDYLIMFYNDWHEERESYNFGHKVMDILKRNKVAYETTSPEDCVAEVTIWVPNKDFKKSQILISK